MFRAESALAPTSPHAAHNISDSTIAQLLRRRISTLNPLESALPTTQISPFANPIEPTPFFPIAPFRANSAPVTPAYTTLTKPTARNPIRMNTYTKHQVAPHPHHRLNLFILNGLCQLHHVVVTLLPSQPSQFAPSLLTSLHHPSTSSPSHLESRILCDSIPGKFSDHDLRNSLHQTAPPPASWHGRRRSGRLHRRGASHRRAPRRPLRTGRCRAHLRPGPQPQRCRRTAHPARLQQLRRNGRRRIAAPRSHRRRLHRHAQSSALRARQSVPRSGHPRHLRQAGHHHAFRRAAARGNRPAH